MNKDLANLTKQINTEFTSCSRDNVAIGRMINEATFLLTDLSGELIIGAYEEWLDSLTLSRGYVEVISNSYFRVKPLTITCIYYRQQKTR